MQFLKQLKWNLIVLAVLFVILGVILIVWPKQFLHVSCYMLAVMLFILGVLSLISYMRKDIEGIMSQHNLVVGFCSVLGAILIIIKVDQLIGLIPVVLGFLITASGVLKIQNSVDMLRMGYGTWHVAFALAALNIVFGIVLLIAPFASDLLVILLGIALIYSGLTDLYVTVAISRKIVNAMKRGASNEDDEERELEMVKK